MQNELNSSRVSPSRNLNPNDGPSPRRFEDAINVERQRKISVPKSGMDGRGVSQGGLYGRGKATVEEEEEEEEQETAFDDSNIRSLLQVRGLAFLFAVSTLFHEANAAGVNLFCVCEIMDETVSFLVIWLEMFALFLDASPWRHSPLSHLFVDGCTIQSNTVVCGWLYWMVCGWLYVPVRHAVLLCVATL